MLAPILDQHTSLLDFGRSFSMKLPLLTILNKKFKYTLRNYKYVK